MAKTIGQETFSTEIREILEEVFDVHHGFLLDKGTSLLATLDGVSAAAASAPIALGTVSIATHVEHIIFYIDVLGKGIAGQEIGEIDWREIWERVGEVNEEAWDDLRARLRAEYTWLMAILNDVQDWRENDAVGASIVILAHTACHLGVIRQALAMCGGEPL
jgi:hypothetical protein